MSADLIVMPGGQTGNSDYMPAISVAQALERRRLIVDLVSQVMVEGVDYGKIPGTAKKTLLKPGAEKLCTFFALTPRFDTLEKCEDWMGRDHEGEAFFFYRYCCTLWRGDRRMAEGVGSCNSRETKYRYRDRKRICPACGSEAIIKGRDEYGGGWLCHKKQGGCGAKYPDDADVIANQTAGRVLNPDICDLPNTVDKMAQKRSLIAAVLLAINASEFFTQDVEDFASTPAPPDAETGAIVPATPPAGPEPPAPDAAARVTLAEAKERFIARCSLVGYSGKPRPLLTRLLALDANADITRNTYLRALNCPDSAWQTAAQTAQQPATNIAIKRTINLPPCPSFNPGGQT